MAGAGLSGVVAVASTVTASHSLFLLQRTRNYSFSHDQALNFKGNTSVFLLYALARLRALRTAVAGAADGTWPLVDDGALFEDASFAHPSERALAVTLAQLTDAVGDATDALAPHVLTDHLFRTAQRFHAFYSACRIADAGAKEAPLRQALCAGTDAALRHGLHLLGVPIVDRL